MSLVQTEPATRRTYEANIRFFYLYKFLSNFQLWIPIWVLYLQQDRGLSLTQITVLEAGFQVTVVVMQIPTGAFADRWGRRYSLLLSGVGTSAAIFLFGIGSHFWILLVSYLVWALAGTLGSGADTAFLHDTLAGLGREGEFGRIVGRAQAWLVGAGVIAALAGAPLASATSLAFPILLSAGIGLLCAFVVLGFREPERQLPRARPRYLTVMREAVAYTAGHSRLRAMIALDGVLLGISLAGMILFQPFLALHHVPVKAFGLLIAPTQVLSVAGLLFGDYLARRFGERPVLCGVVGGMLASVFTVALVPSVFAVVGFMLLRLCTGTLYPVANAYINRHSPDHLRATVSSGGGMAAGLGSAVSEPAFGLAADHFSLPVAFLFAGIAGCLFGGLSLVAWLVASRDGDGAA